VESLTGGSLRANDEQAACAERVVGTCGLRRDAHRVVHRLGPHHGDDASERGLHFPSRLPMATTAGADRRAHAGREIEGLVAPAGDEHDVLEPGERARGRVRVGRLRSS